MCEINDESNQNKVIAEQTQPKEQINTERKLDASSEYQKNCTPFSENWIKRHHKAIMAWSAIGGFLTTFILASIAYLSWEEVKMQRELAFKQFVIANAPSVRVYAKKGFTFENDTGWIQWHAVNKGGYVTDLEFKTLILCCGKVEISNPNTTKVIARTVISSRLNKEEIEIIRLTIINKEEIEWLKQAFENENQVIFYIQANYTIPHELSLSGEQTKDTVYAIKLWISHTKSFENLPANHTKDIMEIIRDRGYLNQE